MSVARFQNPIPAPVGGDVCGDVVVMLVVALALAFVFVLVVTYPYHSS